jgi:hypothetical protein
MSNKRTDAQISEHRIRHAFEFASGATRLTLLRAARRALGYSATSKLNFTHP